ncbi:MAG: membrane protein [Bacteroidia bacterium]|nr:MAG: membrane protein [Bacteroidia bacterium]
MWWLAWRYIWASPRSVVRWLVRLTFLVVALSVAAWIGVASVFNGFAAFLEEVFQRVDPDVRLEGVGLSDSLLQVLRRWSGVEAASGVYERIALLRYGQRQAVVRLRLVDEAYPQVSRVGHQLVLGESFPLDRKGVLIGSGVAVRLALLDPSESPLWMYVIPSGKRLAHYDPEALPHKRVFPQGIFSVQREYDESWVIAAQRDWPEIRGSYDVIELRLRPGRAVEKFLPALKRRLPAGVFAQDMRAQHAGFFRVLAQEKALARIGLAFVLLLTASSAFSTLSTLLLLNRRDWALYQALGATPDQVVGVIGRIVVWLLGVGGGLGILLGTALVASQATFHWAKLRGGEGFLLQHFPVKLAWVDFAWIGLLLGLVGLGLWLYGRYQVYRVSFRAALQGD